MKTCPRCEKKTDLSEKNPEKCKLLDFGNWANEENRISRPIKSEDFYED